MSDVVTVCGCTRYQVPGTYSVLRNDRKRRKRERKEFLRTTHTLHLTWDTGHEVESERQTQTDKPFVG